MLEPRISNMVSLLRADRNMVQIAGYRAPDLEAIGTHSGRFDIADSCQFIRSRCILQLPPKYPHICPYDAR